MFFVVDVVHKDVPLGIEANHFFVEVDSEEKLKEYLDNNIEKRSLDGTEFDLGGLCKQDPCPRGHYYKIKKAKLIKI